MTRSTHHSKKNQPRRLWRSIDRWFVAEEREQVTTFERGIDNVDGLLVALASGSGRLVGRFLSLVGRGLSWPFRTTARTTRRAEQASAHGLRKSGRELGALIRQIGQDLAVAARWTGRALIWPFRTGWRIVAKVGRVVVAPVRRPFARRAKAEALRGVTMTSDRHAHWELLLLLIGVAVILTAAVAAAVLTSPGRSLPIHVPAAAAIHPAQLLSRLANASPAGIALLLGSGAIALAAIWFWIRMTADAWRRAYPTHVAQTKWRLVTTCLFIPGAAVYFARVYNRWTLRQFVGYHLLSTMVATVAIAVATSTYGTLWLFNQRAAAQINPTGIRSLPTLTKPGVADRPKYGAPLTPTNAASRTDPFAPIAGQGAASATSPSPSPSPSASPTSGG